MDQRLAQRVIYRETSVSPTNAIQWHVRSSIADNPSQAVGLALSLRVYTLVDIAIWNIGETDNDDKGVYLALDLGYFRERTGVNSRDKRIDILSQKDGH